MVDRGEGLPGERLVVLRGWPSTVTGMPTRPASRPVAASVTSRRLSRPVTAKERLWVLDVPYDDRLTAKWGGARWDATVRRWVLRGDQLPDSLIPFVPRRHSLEQWLADDLAGGWQPAGRTPTVTLHPHQVDAAVAIAAAARRRRPGFLLADQVGVGKTYAVIDAVNRIGSRLNVLVLSPLSVVAHWRQAIDAAGDGTNRWCVVNYDRAKALLTEPAAAKTAKRTRTKNRRHAQQGRSVVMWDVVIADEAHLLRNPTSQRSAAVRQLIGTGPSGKRRRPAFTVWLSATAGQTPLELSYLAPLLADVTGSNVADLNDFERWCIAQGIGVRRGPYGSWKWERNDADLTVMRQLLFDQTPTVGLRRRPSDIAGWPEQQRIAWPVELSAADLREYQRAWDEFCTRYVSTIVTGAAAPDITPDGTSGTASGTASAGRRTGKATPVTSSKTPATSVTAENPLTALLRFRQKASLLRVDATVDLVDTLLGNGTQVVVSVEFLATADAIVDGLARKKHAAVRISGAETATVREQNRVAFQRGDAPVAVITVTEGISLHTGERACSGNDVDRVLVVHDPRWSAIATAQVEGRCHRDGRNAVAYHCAAEGTVEEQVVAATLTRLADMLTMVGDDTSAVELLASVMSTDLNT